MDNRQEMISILMPFKNEEKYIETCLNSIVNQTHIDWELIAVDDHSTDESPHMVKALAQHDSRVRYFLNNGNGVIDALSTAYKNSSGLYLTRMDADDYKSEYNLQRLHQLASPGVLVTGLVKYFRADGLGEGYSNYEQWINEVNQSGRTWNEVYRECVIPSPCWLVHRNDFERAGGFNSALYPEDYDLCFRFYRAGLKVSCVNEVIHFWRDHSNRTTRVSEHYANNMFLNLKIKYFFEIDRNPKKRLVLIGAGKKAKAVARKIVEQEDDFVWLTSNSKKINQNIYGIELTSLENHRFSDNQQVILAISNASSSILRTSSQPEVFNLF